jgi:hypothetical protein
VVRLSRKVRRGLAAAAGIVTIPLVLVGLAAYWIASQLDGCEVMLPASLIGDLGVRPGPGGTTVVDHPPCPAVPLVALVLRGPDGGVLWRADANPGRPVGTLTLGQAPEGFTEVVPLAAPLDPATPYTVQMYVIDPGPGSAADPDAGLAFGRRATFRPADLGAGRVWFRGRSLTPAEFSRQGCASEASEPRVTAAST